MKLRVTFNRKPQDYQTRFDLTAEDYDKLSTPRHVVALKEVKDKLKEIQRRSEEVALGLDPFTFEDFEKDYILDNPLFHQRKNLKEAMVKASYEFDAGLYANRFPIFKLPTPEPDTILATFLFYISKLLSEHRIRTAANYQTTYITLSKFRGNMRFADIDVTWLKQLEAWMLEKEYSKTTVGIYTRCLRTIFNEAIFQDIIKREKHYPFGRRKYQPPASRNVKKALTL